MQKNLENSKFLQNLKVFIKSEFKHLQILVKSKKFAKFKIFEEIRKIEISVKPYKIDNFRRIENLQNKGIFIIENCLYG